jgi:hypothetical protein
MMRAGWLWAVLLVAGCAVSTGPDEVPELVAQPDLAAFSGCFRNCEVSADGPAVLCLSSMLWPEHFTPETRPEAVWIEQGEGESLVVSAISNRSVVKRSRFEAGKHFEFRDGFVELKRDYLASGAGEPGNPFIGVATSKTVLGLGSQGQGLAQQSSAFVGTGFLVIPIAGQVSDTHTFERDESLCPR